MPENTQSNEFFDSLYEALKDQTPDISNMKRSLDEQGVDVDTILSEGLALFSDFKKRRRLELARLKLDRLRLAVATWSSTAGDSVDKIREDIARALAGKGGDIVYQAYHRKLQNFDPADLESLHEDAALLEFISRMESEETDGTQS